MESITVAPFRKLLDALPLEVQKTAKDLFQLWKKNQNHPSIKFEKKKSTQKYNIYSVRIGEHYRALCKVENDTAKWFWIGSHENYNNLLTRIIDVVKNN